MDKLPPLAVLDSNIEFLATQSGFNERRFRTIIQGFADAVLNSLKLASKQDDPIAGLFDISLSADQRRFIAICLLRLLSAQPEFFGTEFGLRHKSFELFDQVLSKDLYPLLKIQVREQNFEKEKQLIAAIQRIEADLKHVIDDFNNLNVFGTFRQNFNQKFRHKVAQVLIWPFLPRELVDLRLNEIFNTVEAYLKSDGSRIVQLFEKIESDLNNYVFELEQFNTKYSREYVARMAQKLSSVLQKHFDESPLSKPAKLKILPLEKKYPLFSIGNSCRLGFSIFNEGPGLAFETCVEIDFATDLSIADRLSFIGKLEPGSQVVEIPAIVSKPAQTVLLEGKLRWTNFDKTDVELPFLVELRGQRSDVDWEAISNHDPYALEPITKEHELVGRKEILDNLVLQSRGPILGSALVMGQKRVGKTSIAKTLKTRLQDLGLRDFAVLYLEGGDYVDPDATKTLATLGKILCEQIQYADPRLHSLPIPSFDNAIAPLAGFLNSVTRIVPDFKVLIILDEFDELPIDLYKRGPIGDAFFLSLRSISGKQPFGFVLVGSEKLGLVLAFQGDRLNKFQPIHVDYFDKETHWTSFQELVKRPVSQWFEFNDQAIVALYEETAGNPFFTKLICRELFKLMVDRRDGHVTGKEVREAVKSCLRNVMSMSFQHFWDDGILEAGDRKEEKSLVRRKILIAIAELLREGRAAAKETIIEAAQMFGLSDIIVAEELHDFERRGVLVQKDGRFSCKVPFFGKWLRERGVSEIITTVTDPDLILARRKHEEDARIKSSEIVALVDQWDIYKGKRLTEDQVRAWLNQWGSDCTDQRLMFRVLQSIKFYSADNIRSKLKEAHGIVTRGWSWDAGKLKRSDVLISYLDSPGKSGSHYARLYADENDIYVDNIVEQGRLSQKIDRPDLQAIVFVDDFFGSGGSASDNLKKLSNDHGEAFRKRGLPVFFIAICGFQIAQEKIENSVLTIGFPVRVHICDPLDERSKCFFDESLVFPNPVERTRAKTLAFQQGLKLEKRHPLGFGDCQSTVIFDCSCPNNTLPILWASSSEWYPLFPRF